MTLQRTLGLRLTVWYVTVFVTGIVVLAALTYTLLASALTQRDHDIIRATVREYASRYELGGLLALQRAVELEERTGDRERLYVRVLGPGADALFARMPPGWSRYAQQELGDPSRASDQSARDGQAVIEVATVQLGDGTILQVGKSNEIRIAQLARFRWIVGLVSVAALAIGLTGGRILAKSTVQPIYDLIGVVRGIIATGRTDQRVPVARGEEGDAVDELSALFNTMLDRINGLIAAMGQSLDNVAHDLRTPLARLRGIAERALQSGDAAASREALETCLEEADRILSMLNTLMDISEAETGVVQLKREPVSLNDLLAQVVELYDDVADDKGVAVNLEPGDDISISAAPDRMRQVFANLLDNAIKYTPRGGRVHVSVRREPDTAVVTVTDTGAGIAPEHLPRIWDRLYRADPSRSERGLGLGLSLVKAYVEAHHGSVDALSQPGQGSTFTVRLPAGSGL